MKTREEHIIFDFDLTITKNHLHNACMTILERLYPGKKVGSNQLESWTEKEIDAIWAELERGGLLAPTGSPEEWRDIFKTLLGEGYQVSIASFGAFRPIIERFLSEVIGLDESEMKKIHIEAWLPDDEHKDSKRMHIDRALTKTPPGSKIDHTKSMDDAKRKVAYSKMLFFDDSRQPIDDLIGFFKKIGLVGDKHFKKLGSGSDGNPETIKTKLTEVFKLKFLNQQPNIKVDVGHLAKKEIKKEMKTEKLPSSQMPHSNLKAEVVSKSSQPSSAFVWEDRSKQNQIVSPLMSMERAKDYVERMKKSFPALASDKDSVFYAESKQDPSNYRVIFTKTALDKMGKTIPELEKEIKKEVKTEKLPSSQWKKAVNSTASIVKRVGLFIGKHREKSKSEMPHSNLKVEVVSKSSQPSSTFVWEDRGKQIVSPLMSMERAKDYVERMKKSFPALASDKDSVFYAESKQDPSNYRVIFTKTALDEMYTTIPALEKIKDQWDVDDVKNYVSFNYKTLFPEALGKDLSSIHPGENNYKIIFSSPHWAKASPNLEIEVPIDTIREWAFLQRETQREAHEFRQRKEEYLKEHKILWSEFSGLLPEEKNKFINLLNSQPQSNQTVVLESQSPESLRLMASMLDANDSLKPQAESLAWERDYPGETKLIEAAINNLYDERVRESYLNMKPEGGSSVVVSCEKDKNQYKIIVERVHRQGVHEEQGSRKEVNIDKNSLLKCGWEKWQAEQTSLLASAKKELTKVMESTAYSYAKHEIKEPPSSPPSPGGPKP